MGGSWMSKPMADLLEMEKKHELYSEQEMLKVLDELQNTSIRDFVQMSEEIDHEPVLQEQLKALREWESRKETPIHEWKNASSVSVDQVLKSQIGKVAQNEILKSIPARRIKIIRLLRTILKISDDNSMLSVVEIFRAPTNADEEFKGTDNVSQALRELKSASSEATTGFKDIKTLKDLIRNLKQVATSKDLKVSLDSNPEQKSQATSVLLNVIEKMDSSDRNILTPKLLGDCLAQLLMISLELQSLPLLAKCTSLTLASRLHRSLPPIPEVASDNTSPKTELVQLSDVVSGPGPSRMDLRHLQKHFIQNTDSMPWSKVPEQQKQAFYDSLRIFVTDHVILIFNDTRDTDRKAQFPRRPIPDTFDSMTRGLEGEYDLDVPEKVPLEVIEAPKIGNDAFWYPEIFSKSSSCAKKYFTSADQIIFAEYDDKAVTFEMRANRILFDDSTALKMGNASAEIPEGFKYHNLLPYSLDRTKTAEALLLAVDETSEPVEEGQEPKPKKVRAFSVGINKGKPVEIFNLPVDEELNSFYIVGVIDGLIFCNSSKHPATTLVYDASWTKVFELPVKISGIDETNHQVCILHENVLTWKFIRTKQVRHNFNSLLNTDTSTLTQKTNEDKIKNCGFLKLESEFDDHAYVSKPRSGKDIVTTSDDQSDDKVAGNFFEDPSVYLLSTLQHQSYTNLNKLMSQLGSYVESQLLGSDLQTQNQVLDAIINSIKHLQKLENEAVGYSMIDKLLQHLLIPLGDKPVLLKKCWKASQELDQVLRMMSSVSPLIKAPVDLQKSVSRSAQTLLSMITAQTNTVDKWSLLIEHKSTPSPTDAVLGILGLLSKGKLEEWVDKTFAKNLSECLNLEVFWAQQLGEDISRESNSTKYRRYQELRKPTYLQLEILLALGGAEASGIKQLDAPDLNEGKKNQLASIVHLLTSYFKKLIIGSSAAKDALDNDSSTGRFAKKSDPLLGNSVAWRLALQILWERPDTKHETLRAYFEEVEYFAMRVAFAFDDHLSSIEESEKKTRRVTPWRRIVQRSIGTIVMRATLEKPCLVKLAVSGIETTDIMKTFAVFSKEGQETSIMATPLLEQTQKYYPIYAQEVLILFSMDPALIDSGAKTITFELICQSDIESDSDVEEVRESIPEGQEPPPEAPKLIKRIIKKPTFGVIRPSKYPIGGILFAYMNWKLEAFAKDNSAPETMQILEAVFKRNPQSCEDRFKYYYSGYVGFLNKILEIADLKRDAFKTLEISDERVKVFNDYLEYVAEDGNYYRNSHNTGEVVAMCEQDWLSFLVEKILVDNGKAICYNQREDRFWDRRGVSLTEDHMCSHFISEMYTVFPQQEFGKKRKQNGTETSAAKFFKRFWNDVVFYLDTEITKIREKVSQEDFEDLCISALFDDNPIPRWLERNYQELVTSPQSLETLLSQDAAISAHFPNGSNVTLNLTLKPALSTYMKMLNRSILLLSNNTEEFAAHVGKDFKALGFEGIMVLSQTANGFYSKIAPFLTDENAAVFGWIAMC